MSGTATARVELRLYVGKFAGDKSGKHDERIRIWAETQVVGSGPIRVFGLAEPATAT